MRNAFKNYRRKCEKKQKLSNTQSSDKEPSTTGTSATGPSATESAVTELGVSGPPAKKLRLYSENELTIDEEEYEEVVKELQEEYKKKNGKKAATIAL